MKKDQKGKFFVIEGPDGTGKTEQFKRLATRLKEEGYSVEMFDFPQYESESSYFVRQYLNGVYGEAREVGPYKASRFFGLDRFDAAPRIRKAREEGKFALSNRFVASNMGHQGANVQASQREEFFKWDDDFEFGELGLPRPDLNIILHMPAEIAYELIGKKELRRYLKGAKRDILERDINHLKSAEKAYLQISELWPEQYTVVECAKDGKPLSIEEIHEMIWEVVKKHL